MTVKSRSKVATSRKASRTTYDDTFKVMAVLERSGMPERSGYVLRPV